MSEKTFFKSRQRFKLDYRSNLSDYTMAKKNGIFFSVTLILFSNVPVLIVYRPLRIKLETVCNTLYKEFKRVWFLGLSIVRFLKRIGEP